MTTQTAVPQQAQQRPVMKLENHFQLPIVEVDGRRELLVALDNSNPHIYARYSTIHQDGNKIIWRRYSGNQSAAIGNVGNKSPEFKFYMDMLTEAGLWQ